MSVPTPTIPRNLCELYEDAISHSADIPPPVFSPASGLGTINCYARPNFAAGYCVFDTVFASQVSLHNPQKGPFGIVAPSKVLSNNASLLIPEPPPGFRLDPVFWEPQTYQFDAREIWLALVSAASLLAQHPGNQRAAVERFVIAPLSRASLTLGPRGQGTTYKVLVWTIREIGRQIVLRYPFPDRVALFDGSIRSNAATVGYFIARPPPRTVASSKESSGNLTASSRRRRDALVSPSVTADEGSIPCSDDPDLVVHYRFTQRPLYSGEVFTAFLSAQTYFPEHNSHQRGVDINAFGLNHAVQLAVQDVDPERGLTWGLARIGLRTVWLEIIMGYSIDARAYVGPLRWESLTFTFEYRNVEVGGGSLS
ncbi:MAG: hypothetical protein Q9212_003085 [Teloschistes hypoglaucus]